MASDEVYGATLPERALAGWQRHQCNVRIHTMPARARPLAVRGLPQSARPGRCSFPQRPDE